MTARQVFEAALIEMNKTQAPSLLLEDFNYLINKVIYQYINKRYNIYDINQQTTDDIRVLKSTAILEPQLNNGYGESNSVTDRFSLYRGTYEFVLPSDYFHILNCVCNFKVKSSYKCYNAGSYKEFSATRLTADLWPQIINNVYMRPDYKRPYYYIHNVNINTTNPTNPYNETTEDLTYLNNEGEKQSAYREVVNGEGETTYQKIQLIGGKGTDISGITQDDHGNLSNTGGLPKTIQIGQSNISNVEKVGQVRYGNASQVRMEVRCGKDRSVFELDSVFIDYIKTPQHIRLTQEQLDTTIDTSQIMEFPDYVCQEIINELVHVLMENAQDGRLPYHVQVNQSIANPVQAQDPAQQQAQAQQRAQ